MNMNNDRGGSEEGEKGIFEGRGHIGIKHDFFGHFNIS